MSIKKSLLALTAMAAFAFMALPAVASAYEVDLPENSEFTVEGETTKLTTPENEIPCASATGSGSFSNGQTGSVKLTFHGCKLLGTNCTTSGQPAGTVQTTTLPFHIVETAGGNGPAILITPNGGHFATFTCFFGLVKIEVGGTGVLGMIESPGIEESSNSMELAFKTEGGVQDNNTIEGDETVYELEASVNGGEAEQAGQDGVGTATFLEGEGTLTE